jgi:hypothetical protein
MLAGDGVERAMRWNKLAAAGASSGVPDIVICSPNKNGSVTFVEMKRQSALNRRNNDCSDKQLVWHARLRELGHAVVVGCGADNAIDRLKAIGYGNAAGR